MFKNAIISVMFSSLVGCYGSLQLTGFTIDSSETTTNNYVIDEKHETVINNSDDNRNSNDSYQNNSPIDGIPEIKPKRKLKNNTNNPINNIQNVEDFISYFEKTFINWDLFWMRKGYDFDLNRDLCKIAIFVCKPEYNNSNADYKMWAIENAEICYNTPESNWFKNTYLDFAQTCGTNF